MKTLRDLALSVKDRKQIKVLGLDKWILDEFDQACSDFPKHSCYTKPNPYFRGGTHIIDGLLSEFLDAALYICAVFRSGRPEIDLATVIVLRRAASELGRTISSIHIMIERSGTEFEATKSYLECLRLAKDQPKPKKHITYRDEGGKGMKIEAQNVQFGYGDSLLANRVLKGVSFNINAGETIGIVGCNGLVPTMR
jgi:ABC-type multidrug transport system fused ATPase/permease subunit